MASDSRLSGHAGDHGKRLNSAFAGFCPLGCGKRAFGPGDQVMGIGPDLGEDAPESKFDGFAHASVNEAM